MIDIKKILAVVGVLGIFASPASAMAATLSLEPASGVLNKGCPVSIKVQLDTQGVQTDGTDMILSYSASQLSASTSTIKNGTIYPQYPGNSVDSSAGKISISGISDVSTPYSGSGTFATITFTVADTLTANTPIALNFDFDPNNKTKTTDTNVVERGTIADVLSGVTNGSYTVGTGSCTSGVQASPSPFVAGRGQVGTLTGANGASLNGVGGGTPSAQYQVYKPNLNDITGGGKGAGLLDNTLGLTAVGILLVVLGVAGLAML